ncbi:MAG: nucleotidyl transferase AbiEii/AbiGii toxin family protein [Candidatus Rokubacteria bacterium]|nr:nucleotidyl transferase AbiEii/AbiGii toxin family protein [Candidatus Rokubacteria bacterium]
MRATTSGLAQSVHTRLLAHARHAGLDPNLVLMRYTAERFLYRLSRSSHVERFVLKGALLLLVWLGEQIRPTRDADLLGFGDLSDEAVASAFRDICAQPVQADGIVFITGSVHVSQIRDEDPYGGKRVRVEGRLGSGRLRLQVDVGIGDAVMPSPEWLDYPSLLDLPRPRLRAYRPETSIAEKLHAMVTLGSKNSRMRDFFDIDALARSRGFEASTLAQAIAATFTRRRTPLPEALPLALTQEFASLDKEVQWRAFQRKAGLAAGSESLAGVVARVAVFLAPVLEAARRGAEPGSIWPAGGPWR